MCHNEHFQPSPRHALLAFEALGLGDIHGELRELGGGGVALAIDWVRTSAHHRAWLPSAELEGKLLLGLDEVTRIGLADKSLKVVRGDSSPYHVVWQRRSAADTGKH